ncbi:hypothetical protein DPMN_078028 [Dreissena polymorpha]|uniref:Uncharacterized protein n=1 Tax=Dreissena polymorpha TaxID=45954 RepID=A0A9D3YPR9_DREPO|nr:hypothetical protein DPMN_078028 [Dreissena polymorpha]
MVGTTFCSAMFTGPSPCLTSKLTSNLTSHLTSGLLSLKSFDLGVTSGSQKHSASHMGSSTTSA